MHSRAVLLLGFVLASPAIAEPPTFDLANASIKKIVSDSAATQYASAPLPDAKPLKREPLSQIDFSPPQKRAVVKPKPKAAAAPQTYWLLDAIIDTLLDVDPDESLPAPYDTWRACQSGDPTSPSQAYVMCPIEKQQRASPKP